MKKNLIISIVAIILVLFVLVARMNLRDDEIIDEIVVVDERTELIYEGDAPVYVTFYSHNEDSWESIVNTKPKYAEYREDLVARAELFAEYGIEWDWQTDLSVVEAMALYEQDEKFLVETDGKHVLVYIQELGAHLDPHAHTNNYADIAYLIEEAGAEVSHVIGGTIYIECGSEFLGFLDFVSWYDEIELMPDGFIYGEKYPEAKWQPLVLSDPGMGGHFFDELTSGVWKPGDGDDFYTNYPENDIVYIGEGYPHDTTLITAHHSSGTEVFASDGAYVKELVTMIGNGELPTGTTDGDKFMYTASIHIRDKSTVTDGDKVVTSVEGMEAMIQELWPLAEEGKVIFVDFEEAARIWTDEYNSVPSQTSMENFSIYDDLVESATTMCESKF